MAMSHTMSGPNEWLHFYDQQNNNNYNNFPPNSASPTAQILPSSLVSVTTTTNTNTTAAAAPLANNNGATSQLSPEGRVSKPIRRRSRASRRTPTTLLNTDTTNFRAMVQQFTGAPFAPAPSPASGFPSLGFGLGSRPVHVNPNGLMFAPSAAAFHHIQQQQQQHYTHSSGNNRGEVGGAATLSEEGGAGLFVGHGGGFFPNTST